MRIIVLKLAVAVGRSLAQVNNTAAPFPNLTFPDAVSPNPNTILGARSNQTSPPKYPGPQGTGACVWAEPYEKAIAIVGQLTLEEKLALGAGWQQEQCVGQTGGVPRLGIRGQCLQDSPVGVRYTE
ncbi:hypothetical protein E4T43_08194 [Aureobasidium subglaciale]|nr:hypothetical protein E4T43_08194 [Aureobasidium subglaciale]